MCSVARLVALLFVVHARAQEFKAPHVVAHHHSANPHHRSAHPQRHAAGHTDPRSAARLQRHLDASAPQSTSASGGGHAARRHGRQGSTGGRWNDLHLPTWVSGTGQTDIVRANDPRHPNQQGGRVVQSQRQAQPTTARSYAAPTTRAAANPSLSPQAMHAADPPQGLNTAVMGLTEWAELGEGNNTLAGAVAGIPLGTTVTVTFVDKQMLDFMHNWVLNCRKAGIKPVVVGAMDAESLEACRAFGVRSFSMEHSISSFGWGAQIGVIEGLMELGYHVLMSDVDTAWIKNPMPYFEGTAARKAADLLISSDCASCQSDEHKGLCVQAPFNIGIMLWRNTAISRMLLQEWVTNLKAVGGVGYMAEQLELNNILRGRDGSRLFPLQPVLDSDPRARGAVLWSRNPNGTLAVGMLPACQFTHGHLYLVAEVPQRLGLDVFVVHATYQFGEGRRGQAAGKRQRLREHGLWIADPDDYFSAGKFLTYSDQVPWYVKEGLPPGYDTHRAVTAYHFKAMMNAAALAKALGRILVLPRWECHCDRHWTPLIPACVMTNSDLKLPFTCPMDHLLEVHKWTEQNHVQVREPGFLNNARFLESKDTRRAVLMVHNDPVETAPALWDSPALSPTMQLEWEPGATDVEARRRIKEAGLDDVPILEFSSTLRAFCGFESRAEQTKFNELMLGASSFGHHGKGLLNSISWCCRNDDPNGYRPVPVPFIMPGPYDAHAKCKAEAMELGRHGEPDHHA